MTDDTSLLERLLTSGGRVQLEPRTYTIARDLELNVTGTALIGGGGTVIQKTSECRILISADWCLLEDIRIDGNRQSGPGVFVTGSFISISRCRSENNAGPGGHGFAFDGGFLRPGDDLTSKSRANSISHCSATSNDAVGIAQYHHWDGSIVDNWCSDNGLEGITVDVFTLRGLINGNSLQHNCRIGGVGAIGMDFADLNRVTNNFIEQTGTFPGITLQNNIGQSNYNIISHNVIVNPSHGIVLRANRTSPPAAARDQPLQGAPRTSNNNLVRDNLIRGASFLGRRGVLEEPGCSGNDIRGNKLTS